MACPPRFHLSTIVNLNHILFLYSIYPSAHTPSIHCTNHNILTTMAAPRLPFLWPMLFRASEQAMPISRNAGRRRALHTTYRKCQNSTVARRYGQANEPPPYLGGGKSYGPSTTKEQDTALPKIGENLQKEGEREIDDEHEAESRREDNRKREAITVEGQSRPAARDPMFDAIEAQSPKDQSTDSTSTSAAPASELRSKPASSEKPAAPDKSADSLLDTVMDPVKHEKDGHSKPAQDPEASTSLEWINPNITEEHTPSLQHPPHIDAPRYVHHFDTYSLVRRLNAGDWTKPQAITVMKSMRLLLNDNLDKARRALVSKSDVENETYLFSAACSELRTEVFARRTAIHEKMRMERDQLQHEVDILEQRLGQETAGMKDELRGMFDDRKMAVRNEQRYMESKVQELNYKITVNLQADSKSDVEGVRWVLTRRVILTLGIIVMMVVSSLKLYSNSVHEKEIERKRRSKMRNSQTQTDDRNDGRGRGNGHGNGDDGMNGHGKGSVVLNEGDNPAFVSLG
jgi:hypothetical protein